MSYDNEDSPPEGTLKPRRGRKPLPAEMKRTLTIDVRVSPAELEIITEQAARAAMGLTTFIRTAALGIEMETPLPPEAFECASALAAIGEALNRATAEIDAGRPVGIDPQELREVRKLVVDAGLAALGIPGGAP